MGDTSPFNPVLYGLAQLAEEVRDRGMLTETELLAERDLLYRRAAQLRDLASRPGTPEESKLPLRREARGLRRAADDE